MLQRKSLLVLEFMLRKAWCAADLLNKDTVLAADSKELLPGMPATLPSLPVQCGAVQLQRHQRSNQRVPDTAS